MRRSELITILNVSIVILILANVYSYTVSWFYGLRPVPEAKETRLLPPPPPDIDFSQDELQMAIQYLNIPTWIRSYRHCNMPDSEVTCSQVVRAYRLIRGWEEMTNSVPLEHRKYFILKHPTKGMGNKMTTDICAFILALMSNRSVLVLSNYPTRKGVKHDHAYKYPPSVFTDKNQLPEILHEKMDDAPKVPCSTDWSCFKAKEFVLSDSQFIVMDDLLYGSMVYVNQDTAEFAWEHFGCHAAYFIGNYFSRFLDNATKSAQAILNNIPKSDHVLGVHVRYHRAGRYYSRDLNTTMRVVYEEIDKRLIKDNTTKIALATDKSQIKDLMHARYGNRILTTDAPSRSDLDHASAQKDMVLVMASDAIIGTYRSTFSWIIVSRSGQRAWWIEKESPHCIPSSNSQSFGVSMIYHWRDSNDWRTNDRVVYCGKQHREILQRFYRYLVL